MSSPELTIGAYTIDAPSIYVSERISVLCGPGFLTLWLALTLSVIITWTLQRSRASADQITPLFLAALVVPIIAGIHEAYLIYTYPGNLQNLNNGDDSSLNPYNWQIFAYGTVCRTSLLISGVILMPLSTFNAHRKRGVLLVSVFGPTMLGFYAGECLRFRLDERVEVAWVDRQGNVVYAYMPRLQGALMGAQFSLSMLFHFIVLFMRYGWRRYRKSELGIMDEVEWEPKGWRASCIRFRNSLLNPNSRLQWINRMLGMIIYPIATVYMFGPYVIEAYLQNLEFKYELSPMKRIISSLYYSFLPYSQYSIWSFSQIVPFIAGAGILHYTIYETWAKRRVEKSEYIEVAQKDLESGKILQATSTSKNENDQNKSA